ncbi:MAG: hypothetical protein KA765_08520 [Thermoflexales bacterium]|nr:hypothetical protein [Thermoflexales bacterium]
MKTMMQLVARRLWILALVFAVLVLLGPIGSQARPYSGGMLVTPVYPTTALEVTVANHPPVAIPYFEWQPVEGATVYRLQISDQIGFNTVARDINLSHVKYLAADLGWLRDTTWYWRVRVEASPTGVGDWPAMPWTFSRSWAKNNAPVLQTPAAGATIEFFEDPIFSWSPVVGAALYVIKIDNDFDCQSPLITYSTMYTHFTPNVRLANANYYWCVLPQDPAGRDGQTSEARSLFVNYTRVTTLLEPANNSLPVYTPQFKWTAVKGAYAYLLYYSTDSTFQTNLTQIQVNQTTYTPPNSLPNDVNYYWKVRAYYGNGYLGQDSAVWTFKKQWPYLGVQPNLVILTPRNNEAINVQSFSWTPVREAAYYIVEGSFDPGFGTLQWSATTPNTWYWRNEFPANEWNTTLYLRVRPYDGNGNPGKASNSISYRPRIDTALVENIYPRYYYVPPSIASGNYTGTYSIPTSHDYALSIPTLYWSRTYVPGPKPDSPVGLPEHVEADYYKLEVSQDVNFFTVDWTYQTQNLSATPDETVPFTPTNTITYYWRVTPYLASGTILTNSATNQPWAVRFDTSRLGAPTNTSAPVLLHPPFNEKTMDTLPSFEWLPLTGAHHYEFEISPNIDFTASAYYTRTAYTHHTPTIRLPKGTYFWRVRGLDQTNAPVGVWSTVRRLIATLQTRWVGSWPVCAPYPIPSTPNTLLASSPVTDTATDLTTLYAAQDRDYWYVGFNLSPSVTGTIVYGLYLDGDQTNDSGASVAPSNRPVITTVNYYRPEYAVYMVYSGTQFITAPPKSIALYRWDTVNGAWDPEVKDLLDPLQVGGGFTYSPTIRYAELKLPKTAIGDAGFNPFVLSPALFSAKSNSATAAADTVPDNGQNVSVFTEVKSISDRLSLSLPSDNSDGAGAPMSVMPFIYAEAGNIDWLRGTRLQIYRDPAFSNLFWEQLFTCEGCNNFVDVFQHVFTPNRVVEDNTLFWRYTVRHFTNPSLVPTCPTIESYSPPSEAHVLVRSGFVPENLRTEGNYSTPTFRWDDVEGAATYRLQWSQNPDFSGNVYDRTSNHDAFTPEYPLTPGTYYWRVRQENHTGGYYASAWSVSTTLAITLPQVVITQPVPGATVSLPPTFKWAAVLTPTVRPTWGAPYYRLQIATSPTGFGSPFEDVDLDTTTWTPNRTYPDGTFYWRIAVRDASRNDGPYTQIYTFTKQYPAPTLIAPLSGGRAGDYPEFEWEMVSGAASYRLQVATNPQFTSLAVDAYTNNVNFIPTNKLATGSYYWRVAMIDRDGRQGPFNDATLIVDPYPYRVYTPLVRK